jgi:hypothetical protein
MKYGCDPGGVEPELIWMLYAISYAFLLLRWLNGQAYHGLPYVRRRHLCSARPPDFSCTVGSREGAVQSHILY